MQFLAKSKAETVEDVQSTCVSCLEGQTEPNPYETQTTGVTQQCFTSSYGLLHHQMGYWGPQPDLKNCEEVSDSRILGFLPLFISFLAQ